MSDVAEDALRRGRRITGAVVDLEEEDGHLAARDRVVRAIAQGVRRAPARDALGVELFDPVGREVGRADVAEDRPRGRRRHVSRAVSRAQQEHRHLGARDRGARAEVAAAASGRDPVADHRLDGRVEGARLRHVEKVGEPAARDDAGAGARIVDGDVVEEAGPARGHRRADACRARDARRGRRAADRHGRAADELVAVDRDRRTSGGRTRRSGDVGDLVRGRGTERTRSQERRQGEDSAFSREHGHLGFRVYPIASGKLRPSRLRRATGHSVHKKDRSAAPSHVSGPAIDPVLRVRLQAGAREELPDLRVDLPRLRVVVVRVARDLGQRDGESPGLQGIGRRPDARQREERVLRADEDRDRDLARREVEEGVVRRVDGARVRGRGGEVLGLEARHLECEHRARGMAEEVDAARIDRDVLLDLLDEVAQQQRPVLRRSPVHRVRRIGTGQDDALLVREGLPLGDERLAVAPRAVEHDDEGRRMLRRDAGWDVQIVGPLLVAGDERALLDLRRCAARRREGERENGQGEARPHRPFTTGGTPDALPGPRRTYRGRWR